MKTSEREAVEILIVDDDPADRKLAKTAFMNAKVPSRLSEAPTAEDALSLLYERRNEGSPMPDLIVLDLNMPGMGGLEFLREVKREKGLSHVPVIVMSSSENEDDIIFSYELHVNAYVTKPSGIKDLERIADALLDFWFNACKRPPKTYAPGRGE